MSNDPGQTSAAAPHAKPKPKRPRRGKTRKALCATSARQFRRKKRAKKVVDLRLQGLAIREIAERVGCSSSEVQRLLDQQLASLEAPEERKRRVRDLGLARLDVWLKGLWKRACRGDEKAVRAALDIERRRAKLEGTDAPPVQQVKLTVLNQINWVFDRIRDELGEDAAQRVFGRIGTESGAPADDDAGGPTEGG